jgi:colanic acid/amylovoran biosynthesis glycosyltransferase
MRIAFLLDCFPTVSETFIVRQITGLLDLGHQVDIYAQREPEREEPFHAEVERYDLVARTTYMSQHIPRESAYWEMPVWPLTGRTWTPDSETPTANWRRLLAAAPVLARCLRSAPRTTLQVLDPRAYGDQARSLSALYRLGVLASQSGPYDVLHAHFGAQGNSFRFARELWQAPLLVTFHGSDFSALPEERGRGIYERLFREAEAFSINSEHTRRCVEALGCPPHKLHRLPVGLDPREFAFRERSWQPGAPLRLLTVGRLVEKKGMEYAIRAVAHVRRSRPELRYDIIGEGPLRGALETLARELGVADCVTLHGAQAGAEVRKAFAAAHLFVLTSVTAADGNQEGQGLVLQEAQACGLPVIATNHNGFPEGIVPGESGFLVPERDVDALAERLLQLLEQPEGWAGMGRCGRRYVEQHYDIRQLNQQLVELYRRVAADPTTARGSA